MTPEERDSPYVLPLFPLPQVVLFPRIRCPLHVFEPRYRQMTEAALAGDGLLGMVAVRPEQLHALTGDPPIFAVGCEGRIVDSTRLADGRFNLLLVGTRRFRILAEPPRPPDRLYRTASVLPLDDPFDRGSRDRVSALRARALEALTELAGHASDDGRRFEPALFSGADDVSLVNGLCQLLDLSPAEKQSLLEADDIPSRYQRLLEVLGFRLAETASARGAGSRQLH
jgi:Lon protease-like protein